MVATLLLAGSPTAGGKSIDPQRAALIAQRYVRLAGAGAAQAPARGVVATSGAPYYLFNDARGNGFVVVAADDEMGEVLAYGTAGPLDTLNANPCVKWLLEGYRLSYEALRQGKGRSRAQASRNGAPFDKTVEPLLTSKWGQGHPFNAMTGYPYSGCVATAVAQLMYYHQWPAQGQGANTYTVTYYNTTKSADFSQSHYDWEHMLPSYRYPVSATAEEEDAVALLMNDVGTASFMQYTPSASGTQGVFAYQALQKHFDYTAAYVTRATEGPNRFAEILRQELLNGCPVYLEGRPAGSASGHAWVTDGFDENGLFHMNFGWEGQGDAYYSITNLSVPETGGEFQGKPLAFNRAVTAILAHPNNGKYPDIDRSLLESSPQLMFNEGGSLRLLGSVNKTFDTQATVRVEMSSFVNRGKPFRGDVGVAVCDKSGTFVRVAYSDDHAQGGLTQRIYGNNHDGMMGTDYLINEAQPIGVDLTHLDDGYYRLVPVCVARHDDGTWDAPIRMKKAPTIEVQLANTCGRIAEMCTDTAHFQLMAQPRLSAKAEQGAKVRAFFTVKNLNGVPRDCYLRVLLLDERQAVVLNTRVERPTEIEGFSEAEIPIVLALPTHLAPGRYKVQLELTADEDGTQRYPINPIHDCDTAYLEVAKAEERPLLAKAEVFLADDSNDKVEEGYIDLAKQSLFKLGVALRASEGRTYKGPVRMWSEDMATKERTQVQGIDDEVIVSSSYDVPLFSYWLRKGNLPWADGHTYRIIVMGQWEGVDVELGHADEPSYCLKREGDLVTLFRGTPTQIEGVQAFGVRREGCRLVVSGSGTRTVRLYNANGQLVRQISTRGEQAVVSLRGMPKGAYLLRLEGKRNGCWRILWDGR